MGDPADGQVIQADWTLIGSAIEPDVQVEVGVDGLIGRVGKLERPATLRLEGQALLPGMINAHSHAFQRGLRGRCERFGSQGGSFWSWRDEMYGLVGELDRDGFHELCVQCFSEMLRAGITTVGEFHYLHHETDGEDYRFDDAVLSAANDAGIRIVLLQACYLTGDIGAPIEGAQRRFAAGDVDAYFRQLDALGERLKPATQSMGLVAHSIRAVPIDDIVAIHRRARSDGLVFHMHVEEQRRENECCMAEYGERPMSLLFDRLDIGPESTFVHCTHTHPDDLVKVIECGANVCICPTTEGNLGDGIADVASMWSGGGSVCLGSDSNVRIDFNEEMRWLEYVQRVRRERRGVCVDAQGCVASALWRAATINGARSLNVNAGAIETGRLADLITIDLRAPALAGWTPETLLTSFVLGCDSRVITRVCVGGKWV